MAIVLHADWPLVVLLQAILAVFESVLPCFSSLKRLKEKCTHELRILLLKSRFVSKFVALKQLHSFASVPCANVNLDQQVQLFRRLNCFSTAQKLVLEV